MNALESIPVADLIMAARHLTTARQGRKSGVDRALWIASRHYVDRDGSVELPKPIVDRAKELTHENVGSASVEG